jgi:hypothetical protein
MNLGAALGETRTPDLQISNPALYPAELRTVAIPEG